MSEPEIEVIECGDESLGLNECLAMRFTIVQEVGKYFAAEKEPNRRDFWSLYNFFYRLVIEGPDPLRDEYGPVVAAVKPPATVLTLIRNIDAPLPNGKLALIAAKAAEALTTTET